MPAPKVIMHRQWNSGCEKGAHELQQVLSPGDTYTGDNNNRACEDGRYDVTDISWDPNYGTYGRMAITLTTTSCMGPFCSINNCCMTGGNDGMVADRNHFWLSKDGTTKGTPSAEITTDGVYYIVAAAGDIPPYIDDRKVMRGAHRGIMRGVA